MLYFFISVYDVGLYFPYLRRPLKVVVLMAEESSVNSVAKHDDKIYVAHSNTNKITLFGSESSHFQMSDIVVKGKFDRMYSNKIFYGLP